MTAVAPSPMLDWKPTEGALQSPTQGAGYPSGGSDGTLPLISLNARSGTGNDYSPVPPQNHHWSLCIEEVIADVLREAEESGGGTPRRREVRDRARFPFAISDGSDAVRVGTPATTSSDHQRRAATNTASKRVVAPSFLPTFSTRFRAVYQLTSISSAILFISQPRAR